MKKLFFTSIFLVFSMCYIAQAQTVIESFDSDLSQDSTYQFSIESAPSRIDYSVNTSDFKEGTGSGHVNFVIGSLEDWGSYAQLIKRVPDGDPLMDWSISDSLSIWIKVLSAPTHPEYMVFRIQIADRPNDTDPIEEYIYENATILDGTHDWIELKVPLYERPQNEAGDLIPDSTGFVLAPTTWGGFQYNNRKLDWDKIVGYNISAITSGYTAGVHLPADSVEVQFDAFTRFGVRAVPAIIFNGIAVPSQLSGFVWGQSTYEIVDSAGASAGHNAIKWIQGDEWANGWTGFGWNVSPAFNLAGAWSVDSLKFKMKAETGVGDLRVQFEDGTAKKGLVFTPTADNAWHSYSFALKDFVYQEGTSNFDSSNVTVFQIMAEATGIAGKVIYFDDIWTGNPVFDVIPPAAPTGISVAANTYANSVIWADVPNESGETYNVYYSTSPFSNTSDNGVEVAAMKIAHGVQIFSHVLRTPTNDASVTYYYAVTCTDASGNESALSANSNSITNTAKGVPVIDAAPSNFAADGDLSEWSNLPKFRMYLSDGSAYKVTNTSIDGDADLSLDAYVAMDKDNLYVAFDVTDDIIATDTTKASYLIDSPDLFIGLYDFHGKSHTSLKRGAEPDYHIRFGRNVMVIDGLNVNLAYNTDFDGSGTPNPNYYWQPKFATNGYIVEAKIPFTDLAAAGNDSLFTPKANIRIPIDFEINDADATGEREGMLTYSPYNEDLSYQDVSRWLYTWTSGTITDVKDNKFVPLIYKLDQNYPNPFNPTTKISYTIVKSGLVTLKIYDILGREVSTLVNQQQIAGHYTVNFDASRLASGVYFYRIQSGSFVSVKKMVLLK